jgi:UDPglucose--hexose-1-phosphate uridylyltransferase
MPRPSVVESRFEALRRQSPVAATEWFYRLCRKSNYIQVQRINKNISWTAETDFGEMEITINLSKPEISSEEVAAQLGAPRSGYPKCLLCAENEGFFGNAAHPARQSLRLVPLQLDGEMWYFQYSPYSYYDEHCIVLSEEHSPMRVTTRTFRRLLDFVDAMPHYFLGSNAGMPVMGGSILSHDHYQGGRHVFPLQKTRALCDFSHPCFKGARVSILKWPMTVIRLAAERSQKGKGILMGLASLILEEWKGYSDESAGVLAHGEEPHNGVSVIARINASGSFEMDVILRNNRSSAEHPQGIFHPREELHHIKKENIGLIEAMGLAVLPGRLAAELEEIEKALAGEIQFSPAGEMEKHADWANELLGRFGVRNLRAEARAIIRNEVGLRFARVLWDAGVFKQTDEGRGQFSRFMRHCGMEAASHD